MTNLFKAAEIVDMGIEKEKKRRDFYGLVAEKFDDKEVKGLFSRLRDWEDTHIKKFTDIRNSIKESEATDSYPGELLDYIKVLLDDRLYREVAPGEFSKNVKTSFSALEYGIGFEKDSILFFTEMLSFSGEANKSVIKELIEEERQHIMFLTELKKKLTA
jgi:rubrerythrin